jgi:Zn-dependent peptidase ImmA (M78 family)
MSTNKYFIAAGEESAQRVRDALGLGDDPINDLVALVERLGYPVVYRQLPANMHGLNVRDMREGPTTRVIVVSTRSPWTQQRYTLAHELCHALYDDDGQVIVDLVDVPERLPELRAECFARHLLLPRRGLARDVSDARKRGLGWADLIAHLVVRWGISRVALLRALEDDGLARPEDITDLPGRPMARLMAEAGLSDTWQTLTVGESEPSSSPWLLNRALEAYEHGWIDAHVIAALQDQDVEVTERELLARGWS